MKHIIFILSAFMLMMYFAGCKEKQKDSEGEVDPNLKDIQLKTLINIDDGISEDELKNTHPVEITGVLPGQTVFYRVTISGPDGKPLETVTGQNAANSKGALQPEIKWSAGTWGKLFCGTAYILYTEVFKDKEMSGSLFNKKITTKRQCSATNYSYTVKTDKYGTITNSGNGGFNNYSLTDVNNPAKYTVTDDNGGAVAVQSAAFDSSANKVDITFTNNLVRGKTYTLKLLYVTGGHDPITFTFLFSTAGDTNPDAGKLFCPVADGIVTNNKTNDGRPVFGSAGKYYTKEDASKIIPIGVKTAKVSFTLDSAYSYGGNYEGYLYVSDYGKACTATCANFGGDAINIEKYTDADKSQNSSADKLKSAFQDTINTYVGNVGNCTNKFYFGGSDADTLPVYLSKSADIPTILGYLYYGGYNQTLATNDRYSLCLCKNPLP